MIKWFEKLWLDRYNRNLILIISGILIIFAIGIINIQLDLDDHPCSSKKVLGQCYHVERVICEDSWKVFDRDCFSFIKSLNLPETRLLGPIQYKCQFSKFDRIFQYKRVSSQYCDEQYKTLDNWRKTNPQFQ